jgi:hypothetical protein
LLPKAALLRLGELPFLPLLLPLLLLHFPMSALGLGR